MNPAPRPEHPTPRSVLIVDQGLLKDRRGKPIHGVELFRLHLVRQLLARGIRVTLAVHPNWRPTIAEWFAPHAHRPDLLITPRFGRTAVGAAWAVLRARAHARKLGLPGGRYTTLMLGNLGRGHIAALKLARRCEPAHHTFAMAHRRPRPPVIKALSRDPIPVLCVSDFVAQRFRDVNLPGIAVMYGLPNVDAFEPPAAPRPPDGLMQIIMLARLPNLSKGLDKAIDAFTALPPDLHARSRLHLVAFVEDPDHPKLTGPGADPNITAHRWVPSHEVADLLRRMDIMLCLSRNETFSQAIVQGMLTGLPIVATSIPVYTEKLDTGGGIIADDPASIARATTDLAADPARRAEMGRIGRATALERYAWDTDRFIREFLFPACH